MILKVEIQDTDSKDDALHKLSLINNKLQSVVSKMMDSPQATTNDDYLKAATKLQSLCTVIGGWIGVTHTKDIPDLAAQIKDLAHQLQDKIDELAFIVGGINAAGEVINAATQIAALIAGMLPIG